MPVTAHAGDLWVPRHADASVLDDTQVTLAYTDLIGKIFMLNIEPRGLLRCLQPLSDGLEWREFVDTLEAWFRYWYEA